MIVAFILIVLSAIAEAVMDTLEHRYFSSVFAIEKLNPYWWDPQVSWYNKYKDGSSSRGPKFFGSTTFLVFTTDAWHLFKMLRNLLLWIGLPMLAWSFSGSMICFVGYVALARVMYGVVFELFYSKVFKTLK